LPINLSAVGDAAAPSSLITNAAAAYQCPFRYCTRKCGKNKEGDVVCHCYCRYEDDGKTKTRQIW
jgi:hypothetical protein